MEMENNKDRKPNERTKTYEKQIWAWLYYQSFECRSVRLIESKLKIEISTAIETRSKNFITFDSISLIQTFDGCMDWKQHVAQSIVLPRYYNHFIVDGIEGNFSNLTGLKTDPKEVRKTNLLGFFVEKNCG